MDELRTRLNTRLRRLLQYFHGNTQEAAVQAARVMALVEGWRGEKRAA